MSTRQENQKLLMATHLPTFKKLKIADPYFIAKSAWANPGESLKIQFFPNELKQEKDIYLELSDFNAVSEDPTHTLYKLKYNPFYKEEYPLEQKTSKSGNDYEVYIVPIEELTAITKDGKEVPYNQYQEELKNPPVETQQADFPDFAKDYANVGLKKKEEESEVEIKNFPEWLNILDRIATALEKIENKLNKK